MGMSIESKKTSIVLLIVSFEAVHDLLAKNSNLTKIAKFNKSRSPGGRQYCLRYLQERST